MNKVIKIFILIATISGQCIDDDNAMSPFGCETAVEVFGCSGTWNDLLISETCSETCNAECEEEISCNQSNWQAYLPNLEFCNLEGVNIAWEILTGINLTGANLNNANLTGSDFSGATLDNATLIGADLTWSNFSNASLINVNLQGAHLGAANFYNANLFGANLTETIVFETNITNACMENVTGFNNSGYIGEANFSNCSEEQEQEDWVVNPNAFEHVMSITGIVFGLTSEGDVLGAFNSAGACIGVAEAIALPPVFDNEYAFLMQVYSNFQGATVYFKFYDIETNSTYDVQEFSGNIYFVSDGILGDLVNPLIFYTSNEANNAPVAQNANYSIEEDSMVTIYLSASDEEGDVLSFLITEGPTNGTISLFENSATYNPNINFNGTDSFEFKANDGQEDSNIATVMLIVNAVNDAPYLFPIDNVSIEEGETFSYNLQAEDADGDVLIYTATTSSENVTLNINENTLNITPQESNTTINVVVTVSDGNATHSTSFTLTVLEQQSTCLDNNSDGWCDNFPTIAIIGGNATILMQGSSDNYVDSGASCVDQEDGDISNQVEVSGEVVNINIPGTYTVSYNCNDSDGNAAQTQNRTVFIIPPTIADTNEDGFDDDAFIAGAQSGDTNLDGILNVIDLVMFIDIILNGD